MKKRYRFNIGQMTADCEANYARICRLLPGVVGLADTARSDADSSSGRFQGKEPELLEKELLVAMSGEEPAKLYFRVSEQSRYTSTLEIVLKQALAPGDVDRIAGCSITVHSITVQMYHDLKLAEVVATKGERARLAHYQYPNASMFQPDEKAQQNHFLAELLSYSVQHGLALDAGIRFDLAAALTHPLNPATALPPGRLA